MLVVLAIRKKPMGMVRDGRASPDFLVANTTSMPNFSLLDLPHGPEDGPVAPRAGPDLVRALGF